MELFTENQKLILLLQKLASGGEGDIWKINGKNIAKIYRTDISPEKSEKLKSLLEAGYNMKDPNKKFNHISWTFPQQIIYSDSFLSKVVGYTMPYLSNSKEITQLFNYRIRKNRKIHSNWKFHFIVARNIAALIESLHSQKIVCGDIKLQNILVNSKGLPTIIDTDSMQFRWNHKLYKSITNTPSMSPPELNLSNEVYNFNHDNFKLAVIIFYLIFGEHPYQDFKDKSQRPPVELIKENIWIGNQTSYLPNRLLNFDLLDDNLKNHFHQAFDSISRPTAKAWRKTLNQSIDKLIQCKINKTHYWYSTNCEWCRRERKLNFDIWNYLDYKVIKVEDHLELLRKDNNYLGVKGFVCSIDTYYSDRIVIKFDMQIKGVNKSNYFKIIIGMNAVKKAAAYNVIRTPDLDISYNSARIREEYIQSLKETFDKHWIIAKGFLTVKKAKKNQIPEMHMLEHLTIEIIS